MTLVPPVISALTAGVLILLQSALVFAAANQRRLHGPSVGEPTDPNVTRAIRRHGNLAENAAIFIACVTLLELLGGSRVWVEVLCAAFVAARLLHAFGLSLKNPTNAFRVVGIILTVIVGLTLGVRLVLVAAPYLRG